MTVVRAAGGVVVRHPFSSAKRTENARVALENAEILLVHRPRYDDWSLPKGKRDPGETDEQCAAREVEEETGLRCRLVRELLPTRYTDRRARLKVVRYWLMEPVADRGFEPNDEIDQVVWASVAESLERLTYPYDAEVVANVRLPFTSRSPARS